MQENPFVLGMSEHILDLINKEGKICESDDKNALFFVVAQ